MCWTNIKNETFVANTDIRVFKIARLEKHLFNNKVRPYFIYNNDIEYVENKTYRCNANFGFCFTCIYENGEKYVVSKAMHSYSVENIRLFHAYNTLLFAGTYKTTPQSQDAIACPQYYNANGSVIMLCTIPKGTRYAINTVGEIVSDEIHVEKIITNPFTFNKDSSLSKRSLEKINKILDNWEKYKHNE
jgi:hypothetical protein